MRETFAQFLSRFDRQFFAIKVEMRDTRHFLAIKVFWQHGHICKRRGWCPDSDWQWKDGRKELLKVLSNGWRKGKKRTTQCQGRRPVHDRQVKWVRWLSQHLWTTWRRKFLVRNHPIGKAEEVIMWNLHSLRLTSRTRSKDDVVIIITLDWMRDLIAISLSKGFLNLS